MNEIEMLCDKDQISIMKKITIKEKNIKEIDFIT